MRTYANILNLCEAIAFLVGLLYWKKVRHTYWKWFVFYLMFIVGAEAVGLYLSNNHERFHANKILYTYFVIPVEFLFFFFLFSYSYRVTSLRWLPLVCALIYLAGWIVDRLYFSGLHLAFDSFSYTLGNLLLLVLVMGYFLRMVMSEVILGFKTDMLFWVGAGVLLYYLGSFPFYGLRNTLFKEYREAYYTYAQIMYVLNSLMYVMFSLSFICGRPRSIIS